MLNWIRRLLGRPDPRPGYIIPPGEAGSWYEKIDVNGRTHIQPSAEHPLRKGS